MTINLMVSGGEIVEVPVNAEDASAVVVSPPMPIAPTPLEKSSVAPAPVVPSTTAGGIIVPKDPPKGPDTLPSYSNMRQIKEALRGKQITEEQYRKVQLDIRAKRQAEYDKLKQDLRARKIDERSYRLQIEACRKKYEGIEP